ncbi:U32 family peptidase [Candidatus Peregrinibacteria bacterium]|nr:U32 family peptidase [Candidatus Peregrinibacteria bacterium]
MEKPELILPGGSPEKMDFAYHYGGDTVYMGITGFSMRSRVNDFTPEKLEESVEKAHKKGKKVYVTTNIFPHNSKIDAFRRHIQWLATVKPDALIVANPGVFALVKEEYPDAKIHISVQANSMNYKDVQFWYDQGARRVVLPRELSLQEIREIHKKVPEMELEAFVHGAICVAYSGRCLMSNYLTMRESNQGICAQSCRWKYNIYLEEEKRPGEYMPLEEDDDGTYFFNARDLCGLPYLKQLAEAGVQGFKVEGRSKSVYYLSTVARIYRIAIDNLMAGKAYDPALMDELLAIGHRGYSPGFLTGTYDENDIHYEKNEPIQSHKFIGVVRTAKQHNDTMQCDVDIRNRIEKGTTVQIITPKKVYSTNIETMHDDEGEEVNVAHGGAGIKRITFSDEVPEKAIIRQRIED